MYEYKSLKDVKLEIIYKVFIEAFSDYQVKLDMSFLKFRNMMVRRGLKPEMSVGIFDDGKIIGLVLNGVRVWNGRVTAYDLGTGIVPEYRKMGLTGEALKVVKRLCREKEVECYLLEVLQENTGAVELYRKNGFKVSREFDCYTLRKKNIERKRDTAIKKFDFFSDEQWEKIEKYCDFNPSWQNSTDSIRAAQENFEYFAAVIEGEIAGYGIMEKVTGDISQIAVGRKYRNRGIGRGILNELLSIAGEIRLLNIDSRDEGMKKFLLGAGAVKFVSQYEMVLEF